MKEWGIHLTQVATRCCGRAKASTKKRIPRLLLWRGVGLRSASDSRSCRPKAATAMNSRVGRLGGHSHDSRNLTFLFRSREATTHRVYLNEVDTPHERNRRQRCGLDSSMRWRKSSQASSLPNWSFKTVPGVWMWGSQRRHMEPALFSFCGNSAFLLRLSG